MQFLLSLVRTRVRGISDFAPELDLNPSSRKAAARDNVAAQNASSATRTCARKNAGREYVPDLAFLRNIAKKCIRLARVGLSLTSRLKICTYTGKCILRSRRELVRIQFSCAKNRYCAAALIAEHIGSQSNHVVTTIDVFGAYEPMLLSGEGSLLKCDAVGLRAVSSKFDDISRETLSDFLL